MSNTTRPIPITLHRTQSQRSSPINVGEQSDSNIPSSGNSTVISQSCPVNRHVPTFFQVPQPPRAPVIGSLPEPTFLSTMEDGMPELILPPPAQPEPSTPQREPSILEFARSCPGDIGYMRQRLPAHSRSWLPSPRTIDEFDLSKSPALAIMSAMREAQTRIPPSVTENTSTSVINPRHFSQEEEESTSTISNTSVQTRSVCRHSRRLTAMNVHEQELAMENLTITQSPRYENETSHERRPSTERRGSYDAGVFHFEEQ